MERIKLTQEQLNSFPKEAVIALYLQLSGSMDELHKQNDQLVKQNEQLMKKIDTLQEGIQVLTQQRFGKKSEKSSQIEGQLTFDFENNCILNEAEKLIENGRPEEPEMETVVYKRKKSAGKRDEDLSGLPTVTEEIVIPEEKLLEVFPKGYKRLPDEVHRDLEFIPAFFTVRELHIAVYSGMSTNGESTVIKADRPPKLLKNSIITPSLAAAVLNAKYINALPLNRFSEELKLRGINISRQVLAGWMIKLSERYFSLLYDEMHKKILESSVIHCDETPFRVIHDKNDKGDPKTSKSYMWVYHSYPAYGTPPVYLYDYCPTRATENLRKFLKGYKGILVTDGYQPYHTLANENDDLIVAGCWAHAKRRAATLCKAKGSSAKGTIALEVDRRIEAIYHLDKMMKDALPEERLAHRRASVKPQVEAFFAWLKQIYPDLDKSSETGKAVSYCLNQEEYLKRFLEDPRIPMDNNDAERSIKKFVVGRKNWVIIDSVHGAKASGVLYSIAETAKANGLKPYNYFKYVLEEMPKHMEGKDLSFIQDLLPWSETLPEDIKNKK